MTRVATHAAIIAVLTILTQVGGALYLLALVARSRLPALQERPRATLAALFFGFYAIAWFPVEAAASLGGRVGLPCGGTGPLRVASPLYCIAHRHYVSRELRGLLEPYLPRAEGAIRPEELVQLLQAGRVSLVDTREAPVFNRAHLPSAINLPLEEIETRLAELHMLTGAPVLYCRAGDKTKDLAARLAEQGLPVAFLEGGVLGWEASGFQLERPD